MSIVYTVAGKCTVFYGYPRRHQKKSSEELDIKPYEAGMRQLINQYAHADEAVVQGELGESTLIDLIVHSGIYDAIARKLNAKGNLSRNSIAESIISSVRKTIIREQLTDTRSYEKISTLLQDVIQKIRTSAAEYEEFCASPKRS